MIGKTISHYRIVSRIGSGAMGEVYKANDLSLRRPVALKFLSEELTREERFNKRFFREAQAASALDHPNVCTIYEIGETPDGRTFIAMCYYEGRSLREHLREGPLSTVAAIEYAVGVADGLDAAHRKGIMHRDVKPANIVITSDGIAKILDFGLAKLVGRSKVTKTGASMGTLGYMSPEQVRGETLDHRTDIFSLGVLLYEMVTGIPPFAADNEAAIIYKLLNTDPAPLRAQHPDLPESLAAVLAKAIAKDPGKRYQTMSEFRGDLLDILREIAPDHLTRFEKMRSLKTSRTMRHIRWAAAGFVVIALLVAAAINRSAIGHFLGFGGLGKQKGVAVLPLEIASARPEAATFAAGLRTELATRIQKLTAYDENLWSVPIGRFKKEVSLDPPRVRGAFGVDAILSGSLEDAPSGYTVRLQLLNARTLDRIGEIRIPTETPDPWHADLNRLLADLLDIDLNPSALAASARGCSPISEAFDSYVTGLGHLWAEKGTSLDSAIVAFEAAFSRDSTFFDARLRYAQAMFLKAEATHDTLCAEEALRLCKYACKADTANAAASMLLGRMLANRANKDAALRQYERAASLSPRDPEALRLTAWTNVELGRYDAAENAYQALIAANPFYWGGYESLGYLFLITGRYQEAIAEFERAAELAPDHAPTYNYLGALYFYLDRWEEAIRMFEKSFALGKSYEACSNLGTLYYMHERFADAARMYEWAWEYDRTDHMVIGNLAEAYYWIPEERTRALTLFERAIALAREKLKSRRDASLLSIIAGYYSVTQPDSAVHYAEAALALDGEDAGVLYHAAIVYETIGSRTRALVLMGDAIEKGYSMKRIEHERDFQELRKDPRYKLLIAEKVRPATG